MPGPEAVFALDVPGIHVLGSVEAEQTWMAGSSPAMTTGRYDDSRISNSRRPSVLSIFFTALEAAISPWLA